MTSLIELYRNPIFGVMILFAIVLVIIIADSVKVAYAKKKKRESLEKLSKNFDSFNLQQNISVFMKHVANPTTTIMRIAETYCQAGNYQQTIAMCQVLSEHTNNTNQKIEILEMLAKGYYKAGFLQRAKSVLVEVLRISPYNSEALISLMQTCESLGEYQEALEALYCLEELQYQAVLTEVIGNRIAKNKNYLKAMKVISNPKLSLETQQEQLLEIYDRDASLHSLILRHLKIYNVTLFWEKILHCQDVYLCIDVLWHFEPYEIPFHCIQVNSAIMDIYRAKGYIKEYKIIRDITLESLQLLNQHSKLQGDLDFSYSCNSCGSITPFYSYRCATCDEIGEVRVNFALVTL
ncbi:hypothetical protein CQA66_05960 [Helicobacter aurati]|uniref:Uncharacterized protein n=1 Tax=Helicobacter aurati TaxID=137778 RepID=A0A3D8J462_9HELI|nr:hypothetical protein [Helicobacter aurati]RDU71644.1 hypothetical protein CQA66_05960 [Helicobacter aurati]